MVGFLTPHLQDVLHTLSVPTQAESRGRWPRVPLERPSFISWNALLQCVTDSKLRVLAGSCHAEGWFQEGPGRGQIRDTGRTMGWGNLSPLEVAFNLLLTLEVGNMGYWDRNKAFHLPM